MQPATSQPMLDPAELAELIGEFNEVTTRLQGAHESLNGEVAHLKRELRRANDELERSRRLAALGEMAAGIAHEVRNPLGSIRLHARILEEDLQDRPAEVAFVEKILRAVHGLDSVVGDVLTFAREIDVQAEPVLVSDLFDHALEACAAERPAGLAVETEIAVPGLEIACDPGLVHRVLVNVIRNGLESMSADGVGTPRLTLHAASGCEDEGAGATLGVLDTGPGVPSEAMDRIFNPFFTTRHTGTGLGLAIVHRIMEAHGGSVRVTNVRPHGALVELLFAPGGAGVVGIDEQDTTVCVMTPRRNGALS